MSAPDLSVIVVSDYAAGESTGWDDLRETLAALAAQDFRGTVEFLLMEREDLVPAMPADLREILPALQVIPSPRHGSYELKNHGMTIARAGIVAMLDADCRPDPHWLSRIAAGFEAHPDAAAISGRTTYEGRNVWERVLALLSRSYLDRGSEGPIDFACNNNVAWRRAAYLKHPLPENFGPFAGRIQSESVLRAGGKLLFDPSIRVIHEFEGWHMEADIRKNAGYGTVITRLRDARMPYAGLVRLGPVSIPLIVAGKILHRWSDCFRCWKHYGVGWYELPIALALATFLGMLEIPGMWTAFNQRQISATAYR